MCCKIRGKKMKTEWDYTELAEAYLKRPDYAGDALAEIFRLADMRHGDKVADLGAGVAHLTLPLLAQGFEVSAVEPNDAMRRLGMARTAGNPRAHWSEGTGEASGLPGGVYDLVTFGSSFNVCNRPAALQETHRLLKPGGHFACLWNHRDVEDPVQKRIEAIIKTAIPDYGYGSRREDQTEVIKASGLFDQITPVTGAIVWTQPIEDTVRAWESHATLHRQAGDKFAQIIADIKDFLDSLGVREIQIPYTTRAWVARAI